MKRFITKMVAVVVTILMSWLCLLLWLFAPEIVEYYGCPDWVPYILAILSGAVGIMASCLGYEQKDDIQS